MVHSRNDCSKRGCGARKKQCCVFEDLGHRISHWTSVLKEGHNEESVVEDRKTTNNGWTQGGLGWVEMESCKNMCKQTPTFRVSCSCSAICHSSSLNSYCHRLATLFPAISSTAVLYASANTSISNVKFHLVDTSHGILHASNFNFTSVWNHTGKIIVADLIMVNAIFWSYTIHPNQMCCAEWQSITYLYKHQPY